MVRSEPPLYDIDLVRNAATLRILLRGEFDLAASPAVTRGLRAAGLTLSLTFSDAPEDQLPPSS